MTIKCGFFNSVDGDRAYSADEMSRYYTGLVSDGVVMRYGNAMIVKPSSGMTVSVGAGKAFIDGKYIEIDAAEIKTLEQSSTNLNRIDAVILRKDNSTRDITLYIKKGTEATAPIAPTVERTNTVKELCLATIAVNKLASEITVTNITDTRMDSTRCGYVTGIVNFLDTSQQFTQWTAMFHNWFDGITETLGVNTKNVQTLEDYIRGDILQL